MIFFDFQYIFTTFLIGDNDIADGVREIMNGLKSNKNNKLKKIELGMNSITELSGRAIGEMLAENQVLKSLYLCKSFSFLLCK